MSVPFSEAGEIAYVGNGVSELEELLVDAFVELGASDERDSFDELAGSDWLEPDDEVGAGDDSWIGDGVESGDVS